MSRELDNDLLLAPLKQTASDGIILGGVLLKTKIGEGGAGSVYSGVHTRLNIPVAIKVLKDASPDNLPCFLREAQLTVSIEHPNLVRVYDLNCDASSGLYYLVMEHIDGCSAYQLLDKSIRQRGRPLSQASALDIVLSASNAMAVVHEQGIVHRDLKPDNLLIRAKDGVVKVADLGLACGTDAGSDKHQMVGTIGFLSPEVIRGRVATPASDVYALGACFYELVTGTLPFGEMAENYYYECQLQEQPADPRSHGVDLDEELCAVIMKCLERKPSRRFANAAELSAALKVISERLAAPETPRIRSETSLLTQPVVMVVDDDVQVLDLMRDYLENSGFRPVCFSNPVEALKNLSKVRPEAAVIDLHMPTMDGVTLCRKFREVEGYEDFPVLMLSGEDDSGTVDFAIRGGIDDYLVKPPSINEVVLRVNLLTKLRNANRECRRIETQLRVIKRKTTHASVLVPA
jgi:serine/threonine protein kinase